MITINKKGDGLTMEDIAESASEKDRVIGPISRRDPQHPDKEEDNLFKKKNVAPLRQEVKVVRNQSLTASDLVDNFGLAFGKKGLKRGLSMGGPALQYKAAKFGAKKAVSGFKNAERLASAGASPVYAAGKKLAGSLMKKPKKPVIQNQSLTAADLVDNTWTDAARAAAAAVRQGGAKTAKKMGKVFSSGATRSSRLEKIMKGGKGELLSRKMAQAAPAKRLNFQKKVAFGAGLAGGAYVGSKIKKSFRKKSDKKG